MTTHLDADLSVLERCQRMAINRGRPDLAQPLAEWYLQLTAGHFDGDELARLMTELRAMPSTATGEGPC